MPVFLSVPVLADDVLDELDRARSAYENQDFAAALDAADTALKLLRQAQAEAWKSMLPDPLPGWTPEAAQSNSVGPLLFGGGTITSRVYRRGVESVEISIIAGPPLILQGIGQFLAGDLVSGHETRLMIIDGHKVTYAKGDNLYSMLIADKVLVRVKGSRGVDDETLRGYVRGVKLAAIAKAAR